MEPSTLFCPQLVKVPGCSSPAGIGVGGPLIDLPGQVKVSVCSHPTLWVFVKQCFQVAGSQALALPLN